MQIPAGVDIEQDTWPNVKDELDASRDRLNHALDWLMLAEEYDIATMVHSSLTWHYQALQAVKLRENRQKFDEEKIAEPVSNTNITEQEFVE